MGLVDAADVGDVLVALGKEVGDDDGDALGEDDGEAVGEHEGDAEGDDDGDADGSADGDADGAADGDALGPTRQKSSLVSLSVLFGMSGGAQRAPPAPVDANEVHSSAFA